MDDIDDSGNFKKRIVPMEVDYDKARVLENVASPTRGLSVINEGGDFLELPRVRESLVS